MFDQQQATLLRDEYLKLQDYYEDFDKRSLTIKGWVSAGAGAAVALGLEKDRPVVWVFIAAIALAFWYLEARWKMFQYAHAHRIRELEAYFRDPDSPVPPMQIYQKWFDGYAKLPKLQQFIHAFLLDFVMLPYVLIIAVAAIAGLG